MTIKPEDIGAWDRLRNQQLKDYLDERNDDRGEHEACDQFGNWQACNCDCRNCISWPECKAEYEKNQSEGG